MGIDKIYRSICDLIKAKTNLDIAEGTAADSLILATSSAINEAYNEIENNKTPHIYTKLEGDSIDGVGMLVGCTRRGGESDSDYLYRVLRWNKENQASNLTAIENALLDMTYSSNCKYVPLTHGIGTGTVYIIPKQMTDTNKEDAINEVKEKLKHVCSPSSYIEYVIPNPLFVDIHVYIKASKDMDNTKRNIESKIEQYINNIKPGDSFETGMINRIGVNETNIEYFSVSNVIIDGKEMQSLSVVQKLEDKLIYNSIVWNEVE